MRNIEIRKVTRRVVKHLKSLLKQEITEYVREYCCARKDFDFPFFCFLFQQCVYDVVVKIWKCFPMKKRSRTIELGVNRVLSACLWAKSGDNVHIETQRDLLANPVERPAEGPINGAFIRQAWYMPALCYSSNYHSGICDQGIQTSRVKMTLTAQNSK